MLVNVYLLMFSWFSSRIDEILTQANRLAFLWVNMNQFAFRKSFYAQNIIWLKYFDPIKDFFKLNRFKNMFVVIRIIIMETYMLI